MKNNKTEINECYECGEETHTGHIQIDPRFSGEQLCIYCAKSNYKKTSKNLPKK